MKEYLKIAIVALVAVAVVSRVSFARTLVLNQ
jgi:hypothetical protein